MQTQASMIRTQGSEVTPMDVERLRDRLVRIEHLKRLCAALRQLARDVKNETEGASTQSAEALRQRLRQLGR